jgi:hypothetical protein
MENGAIIEEGNHDGLLAKGGHYATLFNTYFRHQSLPLNRWGAPMEQVPFQGRKTAEYVEQARELAE